MVKVYTNVLTMTTILKQLRDANNLLDKVRVRLPPYKKWGNDVPPEKKVGARSAPPPCPPQYTLDFFPERSSIVKENRKYLRMLIEYNRFFALKKIQISGS